MPNWCHNVLEVTGDNEELERFQKEPFDFEHHLPTPKELLDVVLENGWDVRNGAKPICRRETEWEKKLFEAFHAGLPPPPYKMEKTVYLSDEEVDDLIGKYGACWWRDYRVDNWGTERN